MGLAKEQEVWYIDIETCGEVAEMLTILPHCIGTKAMEKKKIGF